MSLGRPRLQYLKPVATNTAADSYRAMERMACNNFRNKAANQSKGRGIRRRKSKQTYFMFDKIKTHIFMFDKIKTHIF